jgi:hypothetical protein
MSEHIQEGSILRSSWGYDQTNIDFYKVVGVKNGWAWIVPLGQEITEYAPAYMSEYVVPSGEVVGKKVRRKIRNYGNGDSVGINDYQSASVWSGKPQLQTHTH